MSLSVVIPTHNRGPLLRDCLEAVANDAATSEVIVVLDGCDDESALVVKGLAADDGRIRCEELHPNVGPQLARLHGVRLAQGDAVLCLDDDVVVQPGCVAGHALHHARRTADVIVGYMPVAEVARRGVVAQRYASIYEDQVREWTNDPSTILRYLWGGNVSYRTERYLAAAEQCDPELRFHEDQELGLILAELGCTAFFDPGLGASHLYERSVEAARKDQVRSGDAYAQLLRRHPGVLPDEAAVFASERARLGRRLLVETAAMRPAAETLTRLLTALERHRPGSSFASALLRLATRADYYRGFHRHQHGVR